MSSQRKTLRLFEAYGVELEYMIVEADNLRVSPITDKVIYEEVGAYVSDMEIGEIAWSNELVLHVIELKTNGPSPTLERLPELFQEQVRKINTILKKHGAMLLPTGAHPLMNPFTDTCLWPHEYNAIYEAYDRIFNCKGHGWSNLQSTHINLPFADDEEFGRLHAAIRVLLPIVPALSASSPIMDGKFTGFQDARLEVYRMNQAFIPSIAGKVIPEQVFSRNDYEEKIFRRIYEDIAPHDEEKILQNEFLNSRGAIARFERNAIEIRIIDIQECPKADIAILCAVVAVLKALLQNDWVKLDELKKWHEDPLSEIFLKVIRDGQDAVIEDPEYLQLFGFDAKPHATANELWKHLIHQESVRKQLSENAYETLHQILEHGNLAARILKALNFDYSPASLLAVYRKLALCLGRGELFIPEPQEEK